MTPQDLKTYTLQEIDGWRETMTEVRYVKAEDAGRAILAALETGRGKPQEWWMQSDTVAWHAAAHKLIGGEE